MTSPPITTMRLEPRSRDAQMSEGIRAEIADPLWMLGRQWQLGEFLGDDAARPIHAHLDAEIFALRAYRSGAKASGHSPINYTTHMMPLEVLVESEPPIPRWRQSRSLGAKAGADFLRRLNAAFGDSIKADTYISAYINLYGFESEAEEPPETVTPYDQRIFEALVGQVPDGRRLFSAPSADAQLPDSPIVSDESDRTTLINVMRGWRSAYSNLMENRTRTSAWSEERLEYTFSVAAAGASGEHVLEAREYRGGNLDWFHFDVNPNDTLNATAPDVSPITRNFIPVPVSFQGMPAPRWWQFEDASIDLGRIEVEPVDLSRLLLIEFAVSYGNDWFRLPLGLDVGTVCSIRSLRVKNNFGEWTEIEAASSHHSPREWRMFELNELPINDENRTNAEKNNLHSLLFLPPRVVHQEHGKIAEEVFLLRDESANMIWAVEAQVQGPFGQTIKREERDRNQQTSKPSLSASAGTNADALLRYRIVTDLPEHWIPLLPVFDRSDLKGKSKRIRVGGLAWRTDYTASFEGRILRRAVQYYDEEIPRGGLRLQRIPQCTRGINGELHIWVERRTRPGGIIGVSGLQFDVVDQGKAEDNQVV